MAAVATALWAVLPRHPKAVPIEPAIGRWLQEFAKCPRLDTAESPPQRVRPVGEDAFHVAAHNEFVQQPIERNSVPYIVAHNRASISRLKRVRMNPKPVRTASLFIYKTAWRFPRSDFAAPPDGETANAQPVIDDCAHVHFNRLGRDGPKTQPWRCNGIEIGRVREKGEHLFNWPRQPDFAAELVNVHC